MKRLISLFLLMVMVLALALPAQAAAPTVYTDPETHNVLTLPTGWKFQEKEDPLAKVKFLLSSGTSPVMQYGSTDLWGSLTAAQKKNLPREECDNSQFSRADIADLLGTTSSKVKTVTLGEREYFRAELTKSKSAGKSNLSLTATCWLRAENGWLYLYQFGGDSSHSQYKNFEAMVSQATYGAENDSVSPILDSQVYANALDAYAQGDYTSAYRFFSAVESYCDSSKYLRLIRIRNAGSNSGVGSDVYLKECGLTEEDKKDIDAAAKDFYFADTAQVLLCNSDVACYYLVGKWNGGSKCYIHFKMNKYGGTYNIGSKLSTNYKSTFSINEGELCVDVIKTNKPTLRLTLTGPDTMEVLTYEKNCKTYTLKRK